MPDKTVEKAARAICYVFEKPCDGECAEHGECRGGPAPIFNECATAALSTTLEPSEEEKQEAAWAICPHLRWMLKGDHERPECERCPAVLYYPEVEAHGTRFCRAMADKAANDALIAAARVRVGP